MKNLTLSAVLFLSLVVLYGCTNQSSVSETSAPEAAVSAAVEEAAETAVEAVEAVEEAVVEEAVSNPAQ